MVGTTDTRVSTPETEVTTEDRNFVLNNINKRLNLAKPLTEVDIISERCGVRPLLIKTDDQNNKNEEWMKLSRKHAVDEIGSENTSVFLEVNLRTASMLVKKYARSFNN